MAQSQLVQQLMDSTERPYPAPWRGPLFVIGMWRSGTSLLYALLNRHPQIALLYEGDLFVLRPLFWMPGAGSRWLARWEFWNDAPKRHRLDAGRIPRNISRLPNAMEEAYREYARQKDALIWGEKSPQLLRVAPARLLQDFPQARFIIIWRDPAAICSSVVRAAGERSFFSRRGMLHRTVLGCKTLKEQCDELVASGAPVHQIHYETLVKDPSAAMVDICGFLEIPFVPDVTSLDGADRSAIYEGKHHSLVKGGGIVSSLERPEVLPADLKKKIERYVSLWREESGGKWPTGWTPQSKDCGTPSFRERLVDRVLYRCLRALDSITAFVFCFAPLWMLKAFRACKRRYERSLSKVEGESSG
jgi:hypothetical protein